MRVSVVKCLPIAGRNDDWRRSIVFYTYAVHEEKNYKVMIDGGSCVNIIDNTTIEGMGLKDEPHHSYTT